MMKVTRICNKYKYRQSLAIWYRELF